MKRLYLVLLTAMLISVAYAQFQFQISGSCYRTDTGEVMIGEWAPSGFPPDLPFAWSPFTGEYTAQVPAGWSGVVTPVSSHPGTFSPTTRTYTNVSVDMMGEGYAFTPVTYAITGRIIRTDTGQGVGNICLSGLDNDPVTNAQGDYSGFVMSGWSGTVTPQITQPGTLNPPSINYTNVVTPQTGQNYLWTPVVYTISGTITSNQTGEGLAGVTLNGFPGAPQTDAQGHYSISVMSGFSGTVTPSHPVTGIFNPLRRMYANVTADMPNEDYTWNAITHTLNGRITRAGTGIGISGVTFTGFPNNPVTDSEGNYTAIVPHNFSGTVTPVWEESGSFSPANRVYYHVIANQTNQNYAWTVTANEDEVSVISNLQVFPNPVKTEVTIKFSNKNNALTSIEIFNPKGQVIKSLSSLNSDAKWGVGETVNGIYVIRITSGKTILSRRILVLK